VPVALLKEFPPKSNAWGRYFNEWRHNGQPATRFTTPCVNGGVGARGARRPHSAGGVI